MKDEQQELPNRKRSKKTYEQPHLQVYGDLREITQSHVTGMRSDGGKKANFGKTA
jgi:hypothetical protein